MNFHSQKRRFVDPSGRVIPKAEVRRHIDDYITEEQKEVDRESQKLLLGVVSLAAFFEFMREKIQAWHGITGSIAYGGHDQMTPERWARIEAKVQSEIDYLAGFQQAAEESYAATQTVAADVVKSIADQIPAGLETVVEERVAKALAVAAPSEAEAVIQDAIENVLADSVGAEEAALIADAVVIDKASVILDQLMGATIPSRASMYADAAYPTYENNVAAREADAGVTLARRVCEEDEASCDECVAAATEEYLPLDEVSDIGSLTCMSNCRCSYEFSYEGVEPINIDQTVNEIFA